MVRLIEIYSKGDIEVNVILSVRSIPKNGQLLKIKVEPEKLIWLHSLHVRLTTCYGIKKAGVKTNSGLVPLTGNTFNI